MNIKEDDTIEGLDEQFNIIKEGYKDLFEQPLRGFTPNNNVDSSGQGAELDQIVKTIKQNLG